MTKNSDPLPDDQVKRILKDHKVFWTTVPIELSISGEGITRVGISLVLVGADADKTGALSDKGGPSVFDQLCNVAQWLIPEETPNVRIEIRRNEQYVFYTADELESNRKRYAVGMRILHSGKFDEPFDNDQQDLFEYFKKKLHEVGCPKEHWKETGSHLNL